MSSKGDCYTLLVSPPPPQQHNNSKVTPGDSSSIDIELIARGNGPASCGAAVSSASVMRLPLTDQVHRMFRNLPGAYDTRTHQSEDANELYVTKLGGVLLAILLFILIVAIPTTCIFWCTNHEVIVNQIEVEEEGDYSYDVPLENNFPRYGVRVENDLLPNYISTQFSVVTIPEGNRSASFSRTCGPGVPCHFYDFSYICAPDDCMEFTGYYGAPEFTFSRVEFFLNPTVNTENVSEYLVYSQVQWAVNTSYCTFPSRWYKSCAIQIEPDIKWSGFAGAQNGDLLSIDYSVQHYRYVDSNRFYPLSWIGSMLTGKPEDHLSSIWKIYDQEDHYDARHKNDSLLTLNLLVTATGIDIQRNHANLATLFTSISALLGVASLFAGIKLLNAWGWRNKNNPPSQSKFMKGCLGVMKFLWHLCCTAVNFVHRTISDLVDTITAALGKRCPGGSTPTPGSSTTNTSVVDSSLEDWFGDFRHDPVHLVVAEPRLRELDMLSRTCRFHKWCFVISYLDAKGKQKIFDFRCLCNQVDEKAKNGTALSGDFQHDIPECTYPENLTHGQVHKLCVTFGF
ncbi:hypothetical protein Pelo_3314 [Pelomyxa schiedti]|nr:hypothetical protein Pelo_3314 [Pelomyxa schiedti]